MNTIPNIKIEVAPPEMLKAVFAVRKKVFVKELKISNDLDSNDACSAHLLAYIQKNRRILPIGTMRIRFFADFVKFERMAVISRFRKTDVSDRIMSYGFEYVAQKGYRQVLGMCKEDLLPRWEQCGYEKVPDAKPYQQNGMTLIPIRRLLDKHPHPITINSPLDLLTAPEGHWDDPAPQPQEKRTSGFILTLKRLKQKLSR